MRSQDAPIGPAEETEDAPQLRHREGGQITDQAKAGMAHCKLVQAHQPVVARGHYLPSER